MIKANLDKSQEVINKCANLILSHCQASTMHCVHPQAYNKKWTQFRHCQCWISPCINNRYFLVKSYSTIVAVIDDQIGELYELGKWSTTTSKQVTQIFNCREPECYQKYGYSKLEKRYLCK